MPFEQELNYIRQKKELIILQWFDDLDNNFPDFFAFNDMKSNADRYFEYIIEIDISPEIHPFLLEIEHWVEISINNKITLDHILVILHCWKNNIIEILLNHHNSKDLIEISRILNHRLDTYARRVVDVFSQKLFSIMTEKDVKIDTLHRDRLNLIGKMAASMAHEIRNPLTSIVGFLKLIRQKMPEKDLKLNHYIDIIDDEFEAINMQIAGFLSFSKNSAIEEKSIEISTAQIIHATLTLLKPRLQNDNINILLNEERNFMINVQKIAIQQVLSNIINNALDALIKVKYQREIKMFCDEDDEFTYIHIANNGPEIPRDIRESVFEPFMTNKENGTGLGLAICREIMAKNNGMIDFKSSDKETSFILSFSKQINLF